MELALPNQELERPDKEIIEYCQEHALKKFSTYFPNVHRITIDTTDTAIQIPDRYGEYYLIDEDDCEILGVTAFYPGNRNDLILGAPVLPPRALSQLEPWLLQNYNYGLIKPFSEYSYNHEFMPPNKFRITPHYAGLATVQYERVHLSDLSTIGTEFHSYFTDFCYGTVAMMIGRLRKKYSNIATPFGEIQINADEIYNDGETIYNRVLEKFESGSKPNIIMDVG